MTDLSVDDGSRDAAEVNFLSPGFGGLCVVIGAAIAYAAATLSTRQKSRADAEVHREAEIARAWDRFVWLMAHRDDLGPSLTVSLLERIAASAEALDDVDLAQFGRQFITEMMYAGRWLAPPSSSTDPPFDADTGDQVNEGEGAP